MRFALLWTDILIWILVLMIIVFALYSLSKPHLRAPWRIVSKNTMAMSSLLVLLFYVAIALLDSIHFVPAAKENDKNFGETISLLDHLVTGIKQNNEKTYSAPFASTLYSKESVEQANGVIRRIAPRLKHGAAHLSATSDKTIDILKNTGYALVCSLTIWLAILGIFYTLKHKKNSALKFIRLTHNGIALTLLILIIIVIILFFLAPLYHVFGTDKIGQDVLYQAIKSIRTGLIIGTLTTLIMLPFAILLGLLAGYMRGWVDDVIQYLYTTISSIPGVLLIASSILMVQVYIANNPEAFNTTLQQADMRMLSLCIILGITSWTGLCRLIRAETLKLKQMDYVTAAKTLGVKPFKIMLRHLMPNIMHVILISVILDFSGLVLAEAILSYVGVGVDPTTFSWGNMINTARLEMAREPIVWWSLSAAFIFMFTLVLAANLFSDVLREAFNPRSR